MKICGVKATHDAAVALVDDGRLVASIELEKIGNNERYSALEDTATIDLILRELGTSAAACDVAVDGWFRGVTDVGRRHKLLVGDYHETTNADDPFVFRRGVMTVNARRIEYRSYRHLLDHVMAAYATSPFAAHHDTAAVLVWDGGTLPRLYVVDPTAARVSSLGPINSLFGSLYVAIAVTTPPFYSSVPFLDETAEAKFLSVAGKVMAYAGLGKVDPAIVERLGRIEETQRDAGFRGAAAFAATVGSELADEPPANLIASMQDYLGQRIEESLGAALRAGDNANWRGRLCLAGGCALNIKWNSRIRASGVADELWVPPFPNDSGSAIGAAAAYAAHAHDSWSIEWDVYRGASLAPSEPAADWSARRLSAHGLGRLLHDAQSPVVVLTGRAELGPRALGHRSILAAPTDAAMKDHLNRIKRRADYRPVAPVCLESYAPIIFDPGTPDPYMLFDHVVRSEWIGRIPAILHVDGTARLQTLAPSQCPTIAAVLESYRAASGIPVLCNTSANGPGRGFFPDVASAMSWGEVPLIWSDGTLYAYDSALSDPVRVALLEIEGEIP